MAEACGRAEKRATEMIACPSCGLEIADDFAFCPGCGWSLVPVAGHAEERRVVTTLFCDVVAFTAMSEAVDPEDVDALLGRYHRLARGVIESHGGTVEKYIGDAVVGIFGVPTVHEDDPERAVRAGLRILETLASSGLTRPDGAPLQVRCGANTGEALVRLAVDPATGRGVLAGDAVNVAARLEAAAAPMGLVVGRLTHELTSLAIEYEPLPAVAAKGKAKLVEAWLARRPFARIGLRTEGFSDTPFFGRDDELADLHESFQAVVRTGRSHVVLVVGEPGMGKSRLTLEFARSLDLRPEMTTWRQGRCLPYGEGVSFSALSQILKQHAGIRDSDDVAVVEEKLRAVHLGTEDGPWLRQRLRALLGLHASQGDRDENFAAWAHLFELIACGGPAVVVLEDLHWAGEAMLAFVDYLLSRELEAPLLIIATARPELLQQHCSVLTAAVGDGRLRRVTLPTLSEQQTRGLVEALLNAKPASGASMHIVCSCGGNPLFAEQYARLLLDRGSVAGPGSGVDGARNQDLPLPETVHAVLAARLDTLPPEHKALLCDAAVFGETFWRGGVATLSGLAGSAVDEAMATLLARDLVRPVAAHPVEGEQEYLFWHALSRDVAYGQLPRRVRARKHRAAAVWITEHAGERGSDFAETLAHHYATARELAEATGDAELAAELLAPAIDALGRAGDRALRLDVAAAERYFARALELAGHDARARAMLLPRWARVMLLTNRYREAAAISEEAVAGLLAVGDVRAAALALSWSGDALGYLGEPAVHVKQAAIDLLADDGPSRELAEILSHYALALSIQDEDPLRVIEAADRAVEICRLLDLPEPVVALSTRGLVRLMLGDLAGLEDCERAEAAARAQGLGIERSTIELNHTQNALMMGGADAERAALLQGLEFVSRHGLAIHMGAYRSGLTHSLVKVGRWDEALTQISEALPELEAIEDEWDLLFLRSLQSLIFASRGEPERALPLLMWLTDNGRMFEIGWARSYALLSAAAVRVRLGESDVALELIADCFSKPRAAMAIIDSIPEAVRTAIESGGLELAAGIARDMELLLPASRLPLQQHVITTCTALVLETRGGRDAAAAGFGAAAQSWCDFCMPHEEAHALFGQGRCLVALGRAQEAAAELQRAREIFARLGARPALAEVDLLLAQVAARCPGSVQ